LPRFASGDFQLDIPLPFDVDRAARKEVHIADIGLVVVLKRIKEESPQLELTIHGASSPLLPNKSLNET